MKFLVWYEKLKLAFLQLFFPNFCCVCNTPLSYNKCICDKCYNILEKGRIKKPRRRTIYGKRFRIHSIYSYEKDNEASDIVKKLKYSKSFNGSNFMGKAIAAKARSLRKQYDCVTFVPMFPLSEYMRSFNHCEYICSCVAMELGVKEKSCLRKVRFTLNQHNLSSVDRRRNLKGAFRARSGVEGKSILLVDDVTTTGSTMSECANELYKKGAKSVTMIAFALTQRKR